MQEKEIAIIGGGVSGLSAGIYAQQNGYHATIYEMQPYVGGFCTGWYRNGKYLDGCIHWLSGTKKGTQLYDMWRNVNAINDDVEIIDLDSFGTFEYNDVVVNFRRDIVLAEKEWSEIAPEDKKEIHKFFKMVKDFIAIEEPLHLAVNMMPLKDLMSFVFTTLKHPSYLRAMSLSCEDYAKRFKNPAIKNAIINVQPGDGNLFCMVFSYAYIVNGNGGIPKGGSKPMAERMKQRFIDLGGTVKCNHKVRRVLIKDNIAYGIELEDGTKIETDYVISALDAKYAYYHLLDSKYLTRKFVNRINNYEKNQMPSCCLVHLEIEDLPNINIPFTFQVESFMVGTRFIDHLTLRSYSYDKDTYVKNNKTICCLLIDQYGADYEYWNFLYEFRKDSYKQKKEELAKEVVKRIIKRFPELEGKIKVMDVSTPKTLNRYTNANRGAYMPFLFTKRGPMNTEKGYIPGLKNFYVAGQYVQSPGGLPLALVAGKFAIQRICKHENKFYNFTPLKLAKNN